MLKKEKMLASALEDSVDAHVGRSGWPDCSEVILNQELRKRMKYLPVLLKMVSTPA
jgi:hypothetical protein